MNRKEYLLTDLAEEAAEVIQAISKIKRFGPHSYHPEDPDRVSNLDHLRQEVVDLNVAFEFVSDEYPGAFTPANENQMKEARRQKILRYMEISRNLGCLNEEDES